jgi:uncharacterized iron-regulated membrane protein
MSTILNTSASRAAAADAADAPSVSHFYRVVWRWHFYAGLLVIPFMLILAITGIIYLFRPQLDRLMYRDLLFVQPAGAALPPTQQLEAVRAAHPGAEITTFVPAEAPDRSAAVSLTAKDGRNLSVFVNPYSGKVLGARDEDRNLQAYARKLHGELLIGMAGDRIVELVACWALVLLISGLYMWWPRKGSRVWGTLLPRLRAGRRTFWRDLHAVPGFWGALIVIFMILSGLPWSGFWGAQFARLTSYYPAQMWDQVPTSTRLTGSLNQNGGKVVPWAAEQMPMPQSSTSGHEAHGGHSAPAANPAITAEGIAPGTPVNLDSVVALAQAKGAPAGFSVSLPSGEEGVYTVSAFPNDPAKEITMHVDQYSGKVLADVRWAQYGVVPKAVELGIMLHEGRYFGLANQLLMLFAALTVIFLAITGTVMWWQRRPAGRIGAPAMPSNFPLWKGAVAIIAALGIIFPLVGISLVVVLLLDYLVIARVPVLKRALS